MMNMKKFIYTILALAVMVGCDRNPMPVEAEGDRMIDVAISLQTKAGNPAPVVNSVRVLAFDSAGNCALNSFFGNGFGYEMTPASDGYIVDITSPLTLTITANRVYDVYVVLNEAGYILADTESQLSVLLDAIEIGDSKTQFTTYYDKGVKYTAPIPASDGEPAFIMSAYQQVTIGDGASTTPQKVEFYTSDTMSGRTMAQITVDKITSEPANGVDYSSPDVPKVFVLGVSLVNVPGENTWTLADGQLGHNFTEIDFGGENSDGYYDRLWEGAVRQKVTLPARRDDYTDSLLYRTSMADNAKTSWSFAHADAVVFHTTDKDVKKGYEAATKGPGAIDNKYENKNDNSVKYLIENVFPDFFSNSSVISETFYSKTATELSELVIDPGEVSDEYWTVNLGNSYYVPENVTNNNNNATCIKVRMAVASPTLQIPHIPDTTFINKLPNPSVLLTETGSTYCISNYDLKQDKFWVPKFEKGQYVYKDGKLQYVQMKDWVSNTFKEHGHIINASDHSIEYPTVKDDATDAEKSVNNYHVYVEGFSKRTEGTGEVYMSNALTDEERRLDSVIWNIPGTTTGIEGASVPASCIELTIPVNSRQFGGDYSVRRNTRYTITLHVDQSTYGKLGTRSTAEGGAIGITATVKTETINDYED